MDHLLSPIELRGKRVRNRVTLTAHTQSYSDNGIHGERVRDYYAARAAGGTGLLVMEPVPAHPTGRVTPQNYDHTKPGFVEGLTRTVEAVHSHGGVLINQIYHMGPNADPLATGGEQWGPSDAPGYFGVGRIHAMTTAEIDLMVRCYADCAATLMRSGTDGIELMFSYDTLVDAFFYDDRNLRTDQYGGSFENKTRFAVELLRAVRGAIGDDPILGVTISVRTPEFERLVQYLEAECDVDYLGIGNGDYQHTELIIPPLDMVPGIGIPNAARAKAVAKDVLILAEGKINRPELAEQALAAGGCDLVGMTRALMADPDLVRKVERGDGSRIRRCVGQNVCISRRLRKFPIACAQNPTSGYEGERGLTPAATPGHVVVVGGGAAGLEAARASAERGHRVTLLEATDALGGQIARASRLPVLDSLNDLWRWRASELEHLGVEVRLGTSADGDLIASLAPDHVLVATGSRAQAPAHAIAVDDWLRGAELPAGDVLLVDEEGSRKSSGPAEALALEGRNVIMIPDGIDPLSEITENHAERPVFDRLREAGVTIFSDVIVQEIGPGSVTIVGRYDGVERTLKAPVVLHAGRHTADDALCLELIERGIDARPVGDARSPRRWEDAIHDGYLVAAAL
jgi:2,4-dienoyl-CoA reductase-like NADH-dependent reductase (Old Yellow Enzyme family)